MKEVTIVIPSWNGKEILKKSLPLVLKNAPGSPIIVIDDGSEDDTAKFLEKYKEVKIIRNDINLGFTRSVNRAVKNVTTKFVCLLNNDVYPEKDFLKHAIKFVKDETVAVTFNERNSSWPKVEWKSGKLSFTQGEKDGFDHFCMWPSGGSCLMLTKAFSKLGGFREIFSPGYFEDIELGFRIWRSGMNVVWSKEATVIHKHETSFKKLDPRFVSDLKQSNELVFTWLTFFEQPFILSHLWFLVSYSVMHPGYIRIIFMALLKFIAVTKQPAPSKVGLTEILVRANQRYE